MEMWEPKRGERVYWRAAETPQFGRCMGWYREKHGVEHLVSEDESGKWCRYVSSVEAMECLLPPWKPKYGDHVRWYRNMDSGTGEYRETGTGSSVGNDILVTIDGCELYVERVERLK